MTVSVSKELEDKGDHIDVTIIPEDVFQKSKYFILYIIHYMSIIFRLVT